MADLLIKDIDTSKYFDIHIVKNGEAWDSAQGKRYEVIEVPIHGDLIDKGELKKQINNSGRVLHLDSNNTEDLMLMSNSEGASYEWFSICTAPVIIEANNLNNIINKMENDKDKINCNLCIHNCICKIWREQECQDVSCYKFDKNGNCILYHEKI